jgi:thioredoxin 1
MGQALKVDAATWAGAVLQTKGLIMVDFWAAWCRPCLMIAPIIEELATEYAGRLTIAKLNTDENPDVASRYQIMGIPTLIFFRDGKPVEKIVGAASKQQFKEKIDSLLAVS